MNGFKVVIESGKAVVALKKEEIAVVRKVKLYKLIAFVESERTCLAGNSDASLWHKRLGHISEGSFRKLLKLVDGINISKSQLNWNICKTCVGGKRVKLSHKQEKVRAKRPLQLVHSDLMGSITPELHYGKRYVDFHR